MIVNQTDQSLKPIEFIQIPSINDQPKTDDIIDASINQNVIFTKSNESLDKTMHHKLQTRTRHNTTMNINFSDGDIDFEYEKSSNSNSNIISSDPRQPLSGKFKKAPGSDDLSTVSYKKYSSLKITPTNTKNKIPLQRTRHMTIGGSINTNNFQKVSIYGKKVHVGLGFPTKMPTINNKESEIIEMSDKSFDSLENLIQKLKDESHIINSMQQSNTLNNLNAKPLLKDDNSVDTEFELSQNNLNVQKNPVITYHDISLVTNEINTTKKKFIEMEANLLNDFTSINSSIDKILEDRKEMQKQHRLWLECMKKQIFKTKEETKFIESFR